MHVDNVGNGYTLSSPSPESGFSCCLCLSSKVEKFSINAGYVLLYFYYHFGLFVAVFFLHFSGVIQTNCKFST